MKEISIHPAAEENPGFLLWRVSAQWSSSTSSVLKPFGLTHPQFVILAIIDRLKRASQEEIGKQAVLDPKVTAHLLRSLQLKGVIEPLENSKIPKLTTTGADLLARVLPAIESADAAFFASVENAEMVTPLQTLARAHFSKMD